MYSAVALLQGHGKTYEELLGVSGLESMEDRRKKQFEKFTKKTSENPRYKK